jgi:hypothetical protein
MNNWLVGLMLEKIRVGLVKVWQVRLHWNALAGAERIGLAVTNSTFSICSIHNYPSIIDGDVVHRI